MRLPILFISLFAVLNLTGQSVYPGQFSGLFGKENIPVKVECFDLADVTLLPSRFRENFERDSVWMSNIEIDRLLHSFYNNSGVWGGKEGGYMTVKKYGGWESLDCELRGHTTGHLLSAYALMHAASGAEIFRLKGDSIIDGLEKVQAALGDGYLSAFPEEFINRNIRGEAVWAPWYTLHKILSGLIDQYLYTANPKALELATTFGDWAYDKIKNINEPTRQKMLRNEFGGINEAFLNLYAITGKDSYKELSEFFYHNDVIDPLKSQVADFGTKHTNTFIPKVLGEIRKYELTGDSTSLDASLFFWNEMVDNHVFAPGCLSDKEHFFDPDHLAEHISGYTGETCCTYNMLKLGRHLFCIEPDAKIFDYYERALYNHILGQQDPQSGMVCYFLPLAAGTHKVYSTPENSFWCCVGSGFENHAKYAESIYFRSADDASIFVNLFIPSSVEWKSKGISLTQENDFPASPHTSLRINADKKKSAEIKLRYPSWAKSMTVKVNGKPQRLNAIPGEYVSLNRKWADGDVIDIDFGIDLAIEQPRGDNGLGALIYGPIVLAGRLGTDGMIAPAPSSNPELYNDYYTYNYNIPAELIANLNIDGLTKTGPLKWQTANGIVIEPLYDIHRERHVIYWPVEN